MKHELVRLMVSALVPVWLLGCNANGIAPQGARHRLLPHL